MQEADEDKEDVEEDLDDENDMEQNSEPEENLPELGQVRFVLRYCSLWSYRKALKFKV